MKPNLRAQNGQMITEAILIMVALMAVTFLIANHFKNEAVLKTLVSDPWQSIAGMLQNGSWGTPDKTNIVHPNAQFRHVILEGEALK